jgi:hypothetical protein
MHLKSVRYILCIALLSTFSTLGPSALSDSSCAAIMDRTVGSKVPRPQGDSQVKINPVALENWVAAHPPSLREAARTLGKSIRYVSQSEFEATLFQTMERYLREKASEDFVIIHYAVEGEKKSGAWVAELLSERFGRMKTHSILDTQELTQLLNVNPSLRLLYVDDASYSGQQLSSAFHFLRMNLPRGSLRRVDVLVAYAGLGSQEVMSKYPQIPFYFGKDMANVWDALRNIPAELIGKAKQIIETEGNQDQMFLPLYLFEHKAPDGLSFPDVLRKGEVLVPGEPTRKLPFINSDMIPVYKR